MQETFRQLVVRHVVIQQGWDSGKYGDKESAAVLSIVSGHWVATRLSTAGHEGITRIAMGTFAYGDVAAGLALCIDTALVLARINALIIAAGTVIWAVLVRLTLALCACKASDTVSVVRGNGYL